MLEICIPYGSVAANYSGSVTLTAINASASGTTGSSTDKAGSRVTLATVPVRLEVWPIDLPRLNDSDAFGTAFTFGSTGQWRLESWYPNSSYAEIWSKWYPFLAKHRLPG